MSRADAVAYDQLVLNPEINSRRALADADVADLVASIPEKGLLQPLLVRPLADGRYEFTDGSRRHRAIGRLIAQGLWPADRPVPVFCREMSDADAREASLIANVQHLLLAPAEEALAFVRLATDGKTVKEIAAHFAIPARRVEQRLAIGRLQPPLIEALAEGTMTVEAAQAFTLAADAASQLEVFADCAKSNRFEPHAIRNRLIDTAVRGDAREARFVGEEAYAAAGGYIRRDLFSETVFFEDGALLAKLFEEKIAATKEHLLAEGWSDVLIIRGGKPSVWNFERSKPQDKNLDDAARERLAVIGARKTEIGARLQAIDEIDDSGVDVDGEEIERLDDENHSLEAEAVALRATAFTPRQKKKAMAAIEIDSHDVTIHHGLIAPAKKGKVVSVSDDDESSPLAGEVPSLREAEGADFSAAFMDEMSGVARRALEAAMLAKPQAAYFCMVASMVMTAKGRGHDAPLRIGDTDNDRDDLKPLLDLFDGGDGGPLAFDYVLAILEGLEPEAFIRLVAGLASLALRVDRRLADPNVQALIVRMDPDVQALWSPDEAFFKKLKSPDLMECLMEVHGGEMPEGLRSKPKKSELGARCLADAVPRSWLPKPLRNPSYALKDILPREAGGDVAEGDRGGLAAPAGSEAEQECSAADPARQAAE